MTHGSLFSGIGGFDLAAEWMGWENLFHCDVKPFAIRTLKYYWPNAKLYNDIKKTDFTIYRGKVDVLTGGFPCQPFSGAGKRKGKEDDRHLWPEMLRAIREIQPSWIVGENVYGLINWNRGMVFNEVQVDLENEGYEVQPYVLPACSINAPHRRDRVWFVAYGNSFRQRREQSEANGRQKCNEERFKVRSVVASTGKKSTTSDTNSNGQYRCVSEDEINSNKGRKYALNDTKQVCNASYSYGFSKKQYKQEIGRLRSGFIRSHNQSEWRDFPTVTPVYTGNDGIPTELDGISVRKWVEGTIDGAGNAVVPPLVMKIFRTIEKYEAIPK